jgi:plasmid stabilization system protein ParE
MASKPFVFHKAAAAEYEAALDWYLKRSPSAAANFAREVNLAITSIAAAPQRWPTANYGTRKFSLVRFPFAVFYREVSSMIQVVAIAHGHRRPNYWQDRI